MEKQINEKREGDCTYIYNMGMGVVELSKYLHYGAITAVSEAHP